MPDNAATEHTESESDQELATLRTLILGQDHSIITQSIRKDAKSIVADVITEALRDRQKKDNSVDKVLQPFVEDSVKNSVAHNSEQMVSSLYPLVGSLVRKSVAAFLSDFMEKTNQLLENSLTIKGLKWRLKARRSGVSYAQYAASQTFAYRVEHVFLIHRETGLLLNTIALDDKDNSDADIVSAMLTAINDFVGDSFSPSHEGQKEQLQSVSTDNFNLLIKPGPRALVVAAVIGNPPQRINDQLQLTIENIHSLYHDELNDFTGDNEPFTSSDSLLRDCLLSEQKNTINVKKRPPWFAWTIVLLVVIYAGYQSLNWMKSKQLHEKIMQLDTQPGLIIKQLNIDNLDEITLDILRDPDAINITDWLSSNGINTKQLNLIERNYHSFEPQILQLRAQRIMKKYPNINLAWQNNILNLLGTIDITKTDQLFTALAIAGFTQGQNLLTDKLQQKAPASLPTSKHIKQALFDDLIGRIASIQLSFSVASEDITPEMQQSLLHIFQYVEQLEQLAEVLNINFGLLIMGSSDSTGNKVTNDILSIKRANNAADFLTNKGLNKNKMYVLGLGQIDITGVSNTARTVMFNIIYVNEE
ncbi:MAG: OmpA family protein [Cognaticolwellia sp.]